MSRNRVLWWNLVLRPALTLAVLVSAYFLLPFTRLARVPELLVTIAGIVAVVLVCAWEIRRIMRVDRPVAQAVEALVVTVGLHLLTFATVYYLLATEMSDAFDTPLTRLDALYFCVTVFATVGFGDIVPVAQATRAVVTVQMLANIVLIGLALRLVTVSVRIRRDRRDAPGPFSG
ncbi:potassium channel family protein [Nocardia sp. NPDC004068]|uniref:potassium channel family protein n=1 Tax=Nocardia sp. NPDC004068 TaxID=3364303 RepID=UPI0036AFFE90